MSNNDASDPDFTIPLPLPPPTPSNAIIPISPNPNLQVALSPRFQQSPKKKRTKTIASSSASSSNPSLKPKPKPTKKPDPNAPNITRPCTECGKKFWSWKALFGHMRCHPERQWRGINPPPDHQQHRIPKRQRSPNWSSMSETDHQVASYLVLLANTTPSTPPPSSSSNVELT